MVPGAIVTSDAMAPPHHDRARGAGHRGDDAGGGDPVPAALSDALAELAAYCREAGLRWRWLTRPAGAAWEAEVQCGQADAQWQRIGAFPRWGSTGPSEVEALRAAAGAALGHWRPHRHDQYLRFMTSR